METLSILSSWRRFHVGKYGTYANIALDDFAGNEDFEALQQLLAEGETRESIAEKYKVLYTVKCSLVINGTGSGKWVRTRGCILL